MAVVVTRNELNQRVVTLTKTDGSLIVLPANLIRLMEQQDISAWYQQANMGTKVTYLNLTVIVRESISEIQEAINWGIPL